jgi:hypothetical protein
VRIPSSSEITGTGKEEASTRVGVSVGSKTLDCIASVVISDFYSNAAAGVAAEWSDTFFAIASFLDN